MSEAWSLVPALAVGLVLGVFFFAGLWWTLRRGLASEHPARWFAGSLLVRTGVTLAGFYLVAQGQWQRVLACLLGFVIARAAVTRLVRSTGEAEGRAEEARHAP